MRRCAVSFVAFIAGMGLLASGASEVSLPPFELSTLEGQTISDLDLMGRTLLLFAVPDSEACDDALRLLQDALVDESDIRLALVVPDAGDATRAMVEENGIDDLVIVDEPFLLASVFGISRVPTVCLLQDGDLVGRLERGFTAEELAEQLADPFGDPETASGEDSRPPSPQTYVAFRQLRSPMLLMFAGAECSYCHYMLPSVFEIAEWLDTWVVITEELEDPGPFESDAARLSMVLDPYWELADAFGVPTVPTVFFVDTDGTIVWSHTGIVEGLSIVAETFVERFSH
jgi:hypothetical protein